MNENTFLRLGNGNGASQPMGDPSMGMNPMGGGASSMPMGDPSMGGGMPGGDPSMMGGDPNAMGMDQNMGGDQSMMGGDPSMMGGQGNEGFDMGIGMTPDEDPKKWLQGAATKLAGELRKYQKDQPSPDIEVDKTAVNTIAAATKDNLDDGQKNELMKSYADTMRGNDNDGDDNSSEDFSSEPDGNNDEQNAGADMNQDMSMPQDQSAQQMMESVVSRLVSEMISDISKNDKKKPSTKVKHQETSKTGYSFDPYTVKPSK